MFDWPFGNESSEYFDDTLTPGKTLFLNSTEINGKAEGPVEQLTAM